MSADTQVVWHHPTVNRPRGCVVWFTGLSGSGKSTIANQVDLWLHQRGLNSVVLDGDNIRHGLNASPERLVNHYGDAFARRFGLGFSEQDRQENIRRIGCVAELLCAHGIIALTAFVSPFRDDRQRVRELVTAAGTPDDFIEIFVDTPLEICQARDPKGLYQQAREGKLKGMTGIDSPYEPPEKPEVRLDGQVPVDQLTAAVIDYLMQKGKIPRG